MLIENIFGLCYKFQMKDKKKTILLLNPEAGKGKGKKNFPYILESLKSKIYELDYKVSEYPRHLVEIAKEAVKNGYKRIITIGGDGTPYEVINGVCDSDCSKDDVEFGFIPAGTGNSFLRDFIDINVDSALKRIFKFSPSGVDLAEFSYYSKGEKLKRYFLNILGVGLISDILELTNEKFKRLGSAGYGLSVLVRLFRGMDNSLNLKIDGKDFEFKNSAMVISNSKFTGGKMKIAPGADARDGKLDIIVFNSVNRREILSIFSKIFSGRHIDHPKVNVLKGSEIELTSDPEERLMADGELLGFTPLKISTHNRRIKALL